MEKGVWMTGKLVWRLGRIERFRYRRGLGGRCWKHVDMEAIDFINPCKNIDFPEPTSQILAKPMKEGLKLVSYPYFSERLEWLSKNLSSLIFLPPSSSFLVQLHQEDDVGEFTILSPVKICQRGPTHLIPISTSDGAF